MALTQHQQKIMEEVATAITRTSDIVILYNVKKNKL